MQQAMSKHQNSHNLRYPWRYPSPLTNTTSEIKGDGRRKQPLTFAANILLILAVRREKNEINIKVSAAVIFNFATTDKLCTYFFYELLFPCLANIICYMLCYLMLYLPLSYHFISYRTTTTK